MATDPYQVYLERLVQVEVLLNPYLPRVDQLECVRLIRHLMETENWKGNDLAFHLTATQNGTHIPVEVFKQVVDVIETATLAYMYDKEQQ